VGNRVLILTRLGRLLSFLGIQIKSIHRCIRGLGHVVEDVMKTLAVRFLRYIRELALKLSICGNDKCPISEKGSARNKLW
jgi:hypothetical protein